MAMLELHMPAGWHKAGSAPERYAMGVAEAGAPAIIASREASLPDGAFATLMQSIAAERYRGRRVRLAAELRTEAVAGAGTIWLRIDGGAEAPAHEMQAPKKPAPRMLAFDNMESRGGGVLSGTAGWTRRAIVLDVPAEATSLHFGFYLRGTGTAEARAFELAEAGPDEPVTAPPVPRLPEGPVNLDFGDLGGG